MVTDYRRRQEAQLKRFQEWREAQGGVELPVTLHTLLRPEQQARIAWLVDNAVGRVLEVGCSWGYVLASIHARNPSKHVGLDIAKHNVELARLLCPDLEFQVGDAQEVPFPDRSFDTSLCAEILEHLAWPYEVAQAIHEAVRVASKRLLVTIPDGRIDSGEALCKKHPFLLDHDILQRLRDKLDSYGRTRTTVLGPFVCLRTDLD